MRLSNQAGATGARVAVPSRSPQGFLRLELLLLFLADPDIFGAVTTPRRSTQVSFESSREAVYLAGIMVAAGLARVPLYRLLGDRRRHGIGSALGRTAHGLVVEIDREYERSVPRGTDGDRRFRQGRRGPAHQKQRRKRCCDCEGWQFHSPPLIRVFVPTNDHRDAT